MDYRKENGGITRMMSKDEIEKEKTKRVADITVGKLNELKNKVMKEIEVIVRLEYEEFYPEREIDPLRFTEATYGYTMKLCSDILRTTWIEKSSCNCNFALNVNLELTSAENSEDKSKI